MVFSIPFFFGEVFYNSVSAFSVISFFSTQLDSNTSSVMNKFNLVIVLMAFSAKLRIKSTYLWKPKPLFNPKAFCNLFQSSRKKVLKWVSFIQIVVIPFRLLAMSIFMFLTG